MSLVKLFFNVSDAVAHLAHDPPQLTGYRIGHKEKSNFQCH